ncbi:hypothetical protein ACS0TY_001594 [Phlomoides rotata]
MKTVAKGNMKKVAKGQHLKVSKFVDRKMDKTLLKLHARANLDSIDKIRRGLKGQNLKKFGESCFGPLLQMSKMRFHGQLYHHLLLNQDRMVSLKNLVFHVGNKDAVFGPIEFSLITGLKFGSLIDCPLKSTLHEKYFKHLQQSISIKDIHTAFEKVDQCSEDCLKLALLLFLYGVLLGQHNNKNIDMRYFHLVDNISEFNDYPWGRVAFEYLIENIHCNMRVIIEGCSSEKTEKATNHEKYIDCNGFIYALQCWAFESIHSAGIYAGILIEMEKKVGIPRIVCWNATPFSTFEQWSKRVFNVSSESDGVPENLTILKRLEPMEFEVTSLAYQSALRWEEEISITLNGPEVQNKEDAKEDQGAELGTEDEAQHEQKPHDGIKEVQFEEKQEGTIHEQEFGQPSSCKDSVKQLVVEVKALAHSITKIEENQVKLQNMFSAMINHFHIKIPDKSPPEQACTNPPEEVVQKEDSLTDDRKIQHSANLESHTCTNPPEEVVQKEDSLTDDRKIQHSANLESHTCTNPPEEVVQKEDSLTGNCKIQRSANLESHTPPSPSKVSENIDIKSTEQCTRLGSEDVKTPPTCIHPTTKAVESEFKIAEFFSRATKSILPKTKPRSKSCHIINVDEDVGDTKVYDFKSEATQYPRRHIRKKNPARYVQTPENVVHIDANPNCSSRRLENENLNTGNVSFSF